VIHVVAAGAVEPGSVSGPLVLRTAQVLDASTAQVIHTYDNELADLTSETADNIVRDLEARCSTEDVTYVVPSLPGDYTVARLDADLIASVKVSAPERGTFGLGQCQVVDALELALAELQHPFDRGYVAIEPAVPLVVTNWYGDATIELATRYLKQVYGVDEVPGRVNASFELLVPPIARLEPAASLSELEHIVARLRRPDGCPWDRDQTKETLLTQFAEELEEFVEAVRSGDVDNQREELGDVFFHVVAQSQLAHEAGEYSLDDVLREITAKLVRRHPHVFGDVQADTYEDVLATWNRVKAEEKSAAGQPPV